MASKSKKRRRVLGASCILAALIIAGSSFAWFTSKDEVTNRLTASSDYGVSIVESFTPPKNWLPGQTINKDVYATNTGNIDAYVKENVTGILNYTYEELVKAYDPTNVKLTVAQVEAVQGTVASHETADGIKTYEAGGYLAWTDAEGVDVGSVNAARIDDVATQWKPTVQGAYIFRRAITGNEESPFTYAGYYYVPAKDGTPEAYYKIVIGNDQYPAYKDAETGDYVFDIYADISKIATVETGKTWADYVDLDTGELKVDVPYQFITEKEVKDATVTFKYEDKSTATGSEHPARLVVEYVGASETDLNAAQADAAVKQVAYQNALGEYDAAKASYDNALANYNYGTKLAEERNKLYNAWKNLQDKKSALDTAATEYENAQKQVNAWAKKMQDGTDTAGVTLTGFSANGVLAKTDDDETGIDDVQDGIDALNPTYTNDTAAGILPAEYRQALRGEPAGNQYVAALTAADSDFQKAYKKYSDLYKSVYGNDGTGNTSGLYYDINQLLTEIQNLSNSTGLHTSNDGAADEAAAKMATLKTKVADLVKAIKDMKSAYANLINATNEVTGLNLGADTSDAIVALDAMISVAEAFQTNTNSLEGLINTYVTEEDEYNAAQTAYDTAHSGWETAIDTYNTNVGSAPATGAKGVYDAALNAIHETTWDSNNQKHQKEDKGTTIVPAYSVRTTGDDPTIAAADVTTLKALTGASTDTFPEGIDISTVTPGAENDAKFGVIDYIEVEEDARDSAESVTLTDWETKVANYEAAKNAAKSEYDDAKAVISNTTGGTIKLYVNLADGYDAYWYLDPADKPTTSDADFYYKKVLPAGATTEKLIDSIEMDKDVTPASYKDLTFDLNVGLDSIQVTYDENQRNYSTEAVNAADATFKLDVTNTGTIDKDTVLTWGTT